MSSPLDSLPGSPLPEAGHDPGDPNAPTYEDKDTPPPPIADPTADMDHDLSDNDSELSDVDEAQFEDFDPANIDIEERPQIAVDEDNVKLLGRHKRKRDVDGEDVEGVKKKKKEGKREKPKKSRKKKDDDGAFSGGEELEGKRARRKKPIEDDGEKRQRQKRQATPENEDDLDPDTRKYLVGGYSVHLI